YESHVHFWMPFNMGEGLHDATWRNKFGGDIYKRSGSHGCVNLPLSAAEKIYDIVEAGWPVIVFYTGDTEEQNYILQNPQLKVIEQITQIGPVTSLEQEPTIASARAAYEALTEEQKALVTNYQDLVNAELTLQVLKEQAAAAAAAEGQVPVDGTVVTP
ncbi:MAG: L,D-transpeptidase, partial [Pseudobutyrivibrio sp.]|nr:L,D-transpeptidase [Pseudobutyrivibrio sp.]